MTPPTCPIVAVENDSTRGQRVVILSPCPTCRRTAVTRAFGRWAECPMCNSRIDVEIDPTAKT